MKNTNITYPNLSYTIITYWDKQDKEKYIQSGFNEYQDASNYFNYQLLEATGFCGLIEKQQRIVILFDNEKKKILKKVTIKS